LQVFGERSAEFADLLAEFGAHRGIGGDPLPHECRAHSREIGRGCAGVIDRHQRFVEGLVDQDAGMPDTEGRINAEPSGDHAHDQERDENPAADRHAERRRSRNRVTPDGVQSRRYSIMLHATP
jgi:hypothetical protein